MTNSLRKELDRHARQTGLRLDIIQQDYLLTWLLDQLAKEEELARTLVFKGGTALRKCYFPGYRFSEDLDYSASSSAPKGKVLEEAVHKLCSNLEERIYEQAPIRVLVERYLEKHPHPQHQEAFVIRAQFPWQREPLTKVMIEVTWDELMVFPPTTKPLIQDYQGHLDSHLMVYSLEEIVLEKLRAILQHTKKLHEREWSRSRARDYYDLWHILCGYKADLQITEPLQMFQAKCEPKGVSASSTDDFFVPAMIETVKQTWDRWLGRLVGTLPDVDKILSELRPAIQRTLGI